MVIKSREEKPKLELYLINSYQTKGMRIYGDNITELRRELLRLVQKKSFAHREDVPVVLWKMGYDEWFKTWREKPGFEEEHKYSVSKRILFWKKNGKWRIVNKNGTLGPEWKW